MRAGRAAVFLVLALGMGISVAIMGGPAAAKRRDVIDVFPGPRALARAIQRAGPGDVLRIHRGRYRGAFEIDKPLTLKAVGPGRVTIDGRCATRFVIDVSADRVTLKGLRVVGATEGFGDFPSEVNFGAVTRGVARDMVFKDTCDAEYGINVFGTGSVVVTDSVATGFSDAGFYVGGLVDGPVRVSSSEAFDNDVGIIVEDSLPGTVEIIGNRIRENATGIWVNRSNGEAVHQNMVTASAEYGIHIGEGSGGNLLLDNVIGGSGILDVFDQGAGNCWNGTTYGTADPNPPPTC